jgi:hypothetical protein
MSDADAAESKRRAEWLHKNKAHRDWIILSVSEVSVIREELLAVERERDEARAACPDGEWVSFDDHKKVHDAASRLLVAINKQLPIGCFSLIAKEYDTLQSALYGRDTAQ